jgi:uncharacterized BrkB/YihY/UPF0761 family membrane protein
LTGNDKFIAVISIVGILIVLVALTSVGFFLLVLSMLNTNPNAGGQFPLFSPLGFILCLALLTSALILYRRVATHSSDKTKRHDPT